MKALKDRISQLEAHHHQLNQTLQASERLNNTQIEQQRAVEEDLEEERTIRKGLQERLRVILEEVEEMRASNANLTSQLSSLRMMHVEQDNINTPVPDNAKQLEEHILILKRDLERSREENAAFKLAIESHKQEILKLQTSLEAERRGVALNKSDIDAKLTHLRLVIYRYINNPSEQVFSKFIPCLI